MAKPDGRPSKLTLELTHKITNAIRLGMYVETAAAFCGISKDTYYGWLKKGAREKAGIHKDFSDAVERAQSEAEFRDLTVIDKAANGQKGEFLRDDDGNIVLSSRGNPVMKQQAISADWKASAWRLERRFPSRWGRREQLEIEHSGKEGSPIEFENKSNDQILAELQEISTLLTPPTLKKIRRSEDESDPD